MLYLYLFHGKIISNIKNNHLPKFSINSFFFNILHNLKKILGKLEKYIFKLIIFNILILYN